MTGRQQVQERNGQSMLDDFREMFRKLEAMPPRVARFYATHAVPYGRVYRMWNTRGEMIAYVNRGQIADMPRLRVDSSPLGAMLSPALTGIPVVYE